MQQEFWNTRYEGAAFAYGKSPNIFFAEQLRTIPPGRILLPMEGEGRNAVFAAALGWQVDAFDFAEEGRKKALSLAADAGVHIQYNCCTVELAEITPDTYDAVGLIYAHLPPQLRQPFHHRIVAALRVGGTLLLEAFHPGQMALASGGPRDPAMLYDAAMLRADFQGMEELILREEECRLDEGLYHVGPAAVVRYRGVKM